MVKVLDSLIATELAFPVIRQRIYDILVAELANQFTLSGDDPVFAINVYQEKSNPWLSGQMPLVNVWYDSGAIDPGSAAIAKDQQGDHFYNLDLYYTIPSIEVGGEIQYGDVEAKKAIQKGASIVYQILGAPLNTRLQFPARVTNPSPPPAELPAAFVGGAYFTDLFALQSTYGDHTVQDIAAFRLRLKVRHTELMPELVGLPLQGIDTIIRRSDTEVDTDIEITINT
jgi:hypothetical protein